MKNLVCFMQIKCQFEVEEYKHLTEVLDTPASNVLSSRHFLAVRWFSTRHDLQEHRLHSHFTQVNSASHPCCIVPASALSQFELNDWAGVQKSYLKPKDA
jgi:hypothetical protein